MTKHCTVFAALLLMLCSCNQPTKTVTLPCPTRDTTKKPANDEQAIMALLFQQRAAEYRALCYQAYNMARIQIADSMKHRKKGDTLEVVTDLDETALDNSKFAVTQYLNKKTYQSKDWTDWCLSEQADTVPGSASFFRYADSLGAQIYYISNRSVSVLYSTINNMNKFNFPQLDTTHFLFKTNEDSKEARRNMITSKHRRIVLLLGDNLADHLAAFDSKQPEERNRIADSLQRAWGGKYIVLPNPGYGSWEDAFYNYNQSLSIGAKDTIRIKNLRSAKY